MSITIDDVEMWVTTPESGHIVLSTDTRWAQTPCGTIIGGQLTRERPKRICKQCRAALDKLTPSKPKPDDGGFGGGF